MRSLSLFSLLRGFGYSCVTSYHCFSLFLAPFLDLQLVHSFSSTIRSVSLIPPTYLGFFLWGVCVCVWR